MLMLRGDILHIAGKEKTFVIPGFHVISKDVDKNH